MTTTMKLEIERPESDGDPMLAALNGNGNSEKTTPLSAKEQQPLTFGGVVNFAVGNTVFGLPVDLLAGNEKAGSLQHMCREEGENSLGVSKDAVCREMLLLLLT